MPFGFGALPNVEQYVIVSEDLADAEGRGLCFRGGWRGGLPPVFPWGEGGRERGRVEMRMLKWGPELCKIKPELFRTYYLLFAASYVLKLALSPLALSIPLALNHLALDLVESCFFPRGAKFRNRVVQGGCDRRKPFRRQQRE